MGTDYGPYNLYQNEPSIPIYFAPKIEDDNKKESSNNSIYSKRKTSYSSMAESESRKSTFDEEDAVNEKKLKKSKSDKNLDKFTKIFKNLRNSPLFLKNESYILCEEDYYLNFDESENIRRNYFSKLIYKNIWTPGQKPKTHNNLFIFDWDNTLFPTSFLTKEELIDVDLPEEYKDIFSILEKAIINIFNLAIDKGDVYIITNSSIGWVEFSVNKYFPNFEKLLNKIHIISARNEYENIYPGEPKIWKQNCFLNLKKQINLNLPTNIICFGDSLVELDAGKKLASKINNSFIKTLKFQEIPEPADIIKQLNLIFNKFDYIYSKAKNLSIRIDKKM